MSKLGTLLANTIVHVHHWVHPSDVLVWIPHTRGNIISESVKQENILGSKPFPHAWHSTTLPTILIRKTSQIHNNGCFFHPKMIAQGLCLCCRLQEGLWHRAINYSSLWRNSFLVKTAPQWDALTFLPSHSGLLKLQWSLWIVPSLPLSFSQGWYVMVNFLPE